MKLVVAVQSCMEGIPVEKNEKFKGGFTWAEMMIGSRETAKFYEKVVEKYWNFFCFCLARQTGTKFLCD